MPANVKGSFSAVSASEVTSFRGEAKLSLVSAGDIGTVVVERRHYIPGDPWVTVSFDQKGGDPAIFDTAAGKEVGVMIKNMAANLEIRLNCNALSDGATPV